MASLLFGIFRHDHKLIMTKIQTSSFYLEQIPLGFFLASVLAANMKSQDCPQFLFLLISAQP